MTGNNCLITELRTRRQSLALSASEVALRSGIDEQLLCGWEEGDSSPSLDALLQWAAALDLKIALAPNGAEPRRGIRADWDKRRIIVDGVPVRLTPTEWRVIERLARTPGTLVTHQELYRYVYDEDWPSRGQATAVRVLITKLRRLLPLQIEARWGQGYTLTGIEPSQPEQPQGEPAPVAEPEQDRGEPRSVARRMVGVGSAKLTPRNPPPIRPALLRTADAVTRHAVTPVGRPNEGRAEELGVIERFLAERGATRCPDLRTIEKAPLPALIWDKTKRKWVRPAAAAELRAG